MAGTLAPPANSTATSIGADAGRDRLDDGDRGVVPADVDGRDAVAGQHEADHRAGQVVGPVGAMLGRHGGDRERGAVGPRQRQRRPRLEPERRPAQAPSAGHGRQHERDAGQEGTPARVEVVVVMVVREQHGIDVADLVGTDRAASCVLTSSWPRGLG